MSHVPKQVVLASASPRRKELIRHLAIPIEIDPSHVSEDTESNTPAEEMVTHLAIRKAAEIAARRPDAIVIGADTTVEIDCAILNKPENLTDAERMLRRLRGQTHQVHTGVAVLGPDQPTYSDVMTSRVRMRQFPDLELRAYLATGESLDKAGAYGIQGAAGALVERVDGSPTNVIGLPLAETVALLHRCGITFSSARD